MAASCSGGFWRFGQIARVRFLGPRLVLGPSMNRWIGVAVFVFAVAACTGTGVEPTADVQIDVILTGLENPRGVAFDAQGGMLVAEAGTGSEPVDVTLQTGKLIRYVDRNGDGDFTDAGEAEPWFEHLPSYNAIFLYSTGRDEVSGPSDVATHSDGRSFLTIDGGFEAFSLVEISAEGSMGRNLTGRSNMTGIGLSPDELSIFVTESTLNQLIELRLADADRREIIVFGDLASGQQSVPAGLAVDPRNGEVLVALFSGAAEAGDGTFIPFVEGDAKIVRVDPVTGRVSDEITGLTTVVDVAIDAAGNVFVVELASESAELFVGTVDLFDPDIEPWAGGYLRFSGKVTMYPSDGGPPRVLADGLDAPTNITVTADGTLYVSTGQGTPGRPILGPDGSTVITGQVIRITGY